MEEEGNQDSFEREYNKGNYLRACGLIRPIFDSLKQDQEGEQCSDLDFLFEVGDCFLQQAEFENSMRVYERILQILNSNQRPDEISLLQAELGIVSVLISQGKYDESKTYLEKIKDKIETLSNNKLRALYFDCLGEIYFKEKIDEQGFINFKNAYQIKADFLTGEELYKGLGVSYTNMGKSLTNLSRLTESEEYLKNSIKMKNKIYHSEHPELAESYHWLGNLYYARKSFIQALAYFEKSLKIRKACYGEDHHKIGYMLNNMGLIKLSTLQYEEALELFEKAIKLKIKWLGEGHHEVARSYNNLGLIYLRNGENARAREYLKKAAELYQASKHPDCGRSLSNIGVAYKQEGKYNDALKYYYLSIRWKADCSRFISSDLSTTYNNLNLLNLQFMNLTMSHSYLTRSIGIHRVNKEKEPDILQRNKQSLKLQEMFIAKNEVIQMEI